MPVRGACISLVKSTDFGVWWAILCFQALFLVSRLALALAFLLSSSSLLHISFWTPDPMGYYIFRLLCLSLFGQNGLVVEVIT